MHGAVKLKNGYSVELSGIYLATFVQLRDRYTLILKLSLSCPSYLGISLLWPAPTPTEIRNKYRCDRETGDYKTHN